MSRYRYDDYQYIYVLASDPFNTKDLLNKLKHSHEFIEVMGIQSSKTKTSQTQDTIVSLHPTAIEQWSTVIRRINAESPGDKGSASMPPAEDALATWLEKMETEEGVQESFPDEFHSDITFDTSYVELYRCSWCRNPSAILRKCSGCGKTRQVTCLASLVLHRRSLIHSFEDTAIHLAKNFTGPTTRPPAKKLHHQRRSPHREQNERLFLCRFRSHQTSFWQQFHAVIIKYALQCQETYAM